MPAVSLSYPWRKPSWNATHEIVLMAIIVAAAIQVTKSTLPVVLAKKLRFERLSSNMHSSSLLIE